MYTIKIDVNDTVYDKVMLFLKKIPIKNIVVEKKDQRTSNSKENIVNFFQSSPLVDEIVLERDREAYTNRVAF